MSRFHKTSLKDSEISSMHSFQKYSKWTTSSGSVEPSKCGAGSSFVCWQERRGKYWESSQQIIPSMGRKRACSEVADTDEEGKSQVRPVELHRIYACLVPTHLFLRILKIQCVSKSKQGQLKLSTCKVGNHLQYLDPFSTSFWNSSFTFFCQKQLCAAIKSSRTTVLALCLACRDARCLMTEGSRWARSRSNHIQNKRAPPFWEVGRLK